MTQYEVLKYLLDRYEMDNKRFYSTGEIAKALNIPKVVARRKLRALFLFGYITLKAKTETTHIKKLQIHTVCIWRINPRCVNSIRIINRFSK